LKENALVGRIMAKMRGVILRHSVLQSNGKVYSKVMIKETYDRLKKRGYDVELDDQGNLVSNGMESRDIKNELGVVQT